MNPRKAPRSVSPVLPVGRPRKKPSRVHLTHVEVRRGAALRLRIAVADDAMTEIGDELGALIKKIAPSTRVIEVPELQQPHEVNFISREHGGDDVTYHASLRENLSLLFSSLCDTSLADALEIAREESARRAEVN